MLKLTCILVLLFSLPAIACQSKVKQFRDVRYGEIKCGLMGLVQLIEPRILHKGKWIRFGIKTYDNTGTCPKDEPSCFRSYYSWKEKTNAFCRKIGLKKSTGTKTYVFHRGVKTVGLINVNKGRYSVRPQPYNDKLSTLKKIYCL